MAIFSKKDDKGARERVASPLRAATGESAISIIGPGMRIQGDLATDGTVRVEGSVHGTIRAGKAVVLGQSGEIVGDVFTQDAVIGGRISGTLVVESRLELQSSCVVEGEIRARAEHLQLHEGARFNGTIQMLDDQNRGSQPAPIAADARAAASGENSAVG